MKPRIRLDPTRPGWGKWECVSEAISFYGETYKRVGKGYSPYGAYQRWQKAGSI